MCSNHFCNKTFQAIRKLFWTIQKISGLSGKYSDYPETFRTIRKFSRRSGNFPVQFQGLRAKTFRTRKNFPDGNATMPRWFLGLCLKIPLYSELAREQINKKILQTRITRIPLNILKESEHVYILAFLFLFNEYIIIYI